MSKNNQTNPQLFPNRSKQATSFEDLEGGFGGMFLGGCWGGLGDIFEGILKGV